MPKINLIAIMGKDRGIGKENQLLWHIKGDLKYFKETTLGHTIIMGRKTFESIGKRLPKRRNIVLSSKDIEGVEVAKSIDDVMDLVKAEESVFVIGGANVYKQFMEIADKIYLSIVDDTKESDTFFPELPSGFKKTDSVEVVEGDLKYERAIYEK